MDTPKPKGVAGDFIMAFAAIAMDELMQLGEPLTRAAEKVGRVLQAAKLPERPRAGATYASMVQGWRERLMEGEGSAPFGALTIWKNRDVYLSVIEGTREERVAGLLDMLRWKDVLYWR